MNKDTKGLFQGLEENYFIDKKKKKKLLKIVMVVSRNNVKSFKEA